VRNTNYQCCQLLARLFSQINQKIRQLAKKFGPLQNLLTNASISVFYTLFLSTKGPKNQKNQKVKCISLQIFKVFYMNNHLQKSSTPFRPFFGIFKENSAANFSGRTNFCRAPFEFCGRNFGPLATLQTTPLRGGALARVGLPLSMKCLADFLFLHVAY
jgi:hypothetical protein